MLKPLYTCAVAESIIDAAENEESLEPEDRRRRPRADSVELSPTGIRNGIRENMLSTWEIRKVLE